MPLNKETSPNQTEPNQAKPNLLPQMVYRIEISIKAVYLQSSNLDENKALSSPICKV